MIRTPAFRTPPLCGRGAGPGSLLPRLMGVDTVRLLGNPTVLNTGISNSNPRIPACNPNEVSVVQLRPPLSAHDTSTTLSANVPPSCVNLCLLLLTPPRPTPALRTQEK